MRALSSLSGSLLLLGVLTSEIFSQILGPKFSAFVNRVNQAQAQDRTAIVDSFMYAATSFPFVEQDTIAQFIYRGAATSVNVPGDANCWNPGAFSMNKLSTTDLWYRSEIFEDDARLEYKFLLDNVTWIADPRNPRQFGSFSNSDLWMPRYVSPAEINYYPGIPHGTEWDTVYFSSTLGNSRSIRIYTPPSYSTARSDSFPVVLFHDGLEYVSQGKANNVIDYLVSMNRIQPIIAVFVPPVNRPEEYYGGQRSQFAAFICNELMPYIDARFRTRRNPASRATIGISAGSVISLYIGYNYPHVFGNIGAHSGANQENKDNYQNGPVKPLKVYADVGTHECGYEWDMRTLYAALQSKGYSHRYNEWHEGHSWGSWWAHLDNALEYFFPGEAVSVIESDETFLPHVFKLEQNYPNPFNPSTMISYELPQRLQVLLRVYDVLGREIATLVNEVQDAGSKTVTFNASRLAAGMYFYRLVAGNMVQTKKMLLVR